ncbi:hypothetical protein LEP1GSC058_2273 [Leptospira fainei serovar Hurstbridge str. BUT 6]|uniref:Uncharacterized protein n=1 Tax=Leptospira fainei serovar Hurstbridge str. BUT 6 TaxID=1193011 RepID=S3W538_9LEPT|nr:hypothetical protein LEP1GSC058_2273 [Leptospira fainei serovar Hurstbridge str. BUT 6]
MSPIRFGFILSGSNRLNPLGNRFVRYVRFYFFFESDLTRTKFRIEEIYVPDKLGSKFFSDAGKGSHWEKDIEEPFFRQALVQSSIREPDDTKRK